jgi:nicotinate-nucleotide--dimethylbenzimidazole phosphoribosyltransferase
MAARLAAIGGTLTPDLSRKVIFTMAGDHGVAAEGVSAYPQEVTAQMIYSFTQGWASINVLARHVGADVRVVDCGVASDLPGDWPIIHRKIGRGTANMCLGPAMSRDQAVEGLCLGAELVLKAKEQEGYQLLATGDMGIGNTTPAAALASVFTGKPAASVTGRGTGIEGLVWRHKVGVINRALALHRPSAEDPVGALAAVGGLEIAGIAGFILGTVAARRPLVLDGFIATAGALVAKALAPAVTDYLIAAHRSVEPGHQIMLDFLGLKPLLNLQMRLGEGTGAALGMLLLEAGLKIYR